MQPEYRARISLKNPLHFLAVGFGSGLVPIMPGTFGSLAALPILVALSSASIWTFLAVTVLASVAGVVICGKTAQDMGVHDHGSIVWDEIAGMLITFLLVPITPVTLLIGFILFRLFDILKPWPIGFIDKHVHGGTGIMLDDIIAGLMACLVLHSAMFLLPTLF